jgi:hypothetical protein
MTRLPIPVHVGSEPLDHWDDIEARQRQFAEEAAPWLQKQRRPEPLVSVTLVDHDRPDMPTRGRCRGRRCRSRPAFPVCSRPVTCGTAR